MIDTGDNVNPTSELTFDSAIVCDITQIPAAKAIFIVRSVQIVIPTHLSVETCVLGSLTCRSSVLVKMVWGSRRKLLGCSQG